MSDLSNAFQRSLTDPAKTVTRVINVLHKVIDRINADGAFTAEVVDYNRYDGFKITLKSAEGQYDGTVYMSAQIITKALSGGDYERDAVVKVSRHVVGMLAAKQNEANEETAMRAALKEPRPAPKS